MRSNTTISWGRRLLGGHEIDDVMTPLAVSFPLSDLMQYDPSVDVQASKTRGSLRKAACHGGARRAPASAIEEVFVIGPHVAPPSFDNCLVIEPIRCIYSTIARKNRGSGGAAEVAIAGRQSHALPTGNRRESPIALWISPGFCCETRRAGSFIVFFQ